MANSPTAGDTREMALPRRGVPDLTENVPDDRDESGANAPAAPWRPKPGETFSPPFVFDADNRAQDEQDWAALAKRAARRSMDENPY